MVVMDVVCLFTYTPTNTIDRGCTIQLVTLRYHGSCLSVSLSQSLSDLTLPKAFNTCH